MNKKRFRSGIVSIFLALSILLSMTGCGNNPAISIQTPSKAVNNASDAVKVTDHLGREVIITGEVNKIVSGYYITSSLLIALGLSDKIVGVEAKAKSRPIYSLSAQRILSLPSVGTAKEFNLEGCIALKPDLVILPVRLKDSVEALQKVGIKVLAVNPEDMNLLRESITLLGKTTRTEKKAENLIRYYDEKMAGLSKRVQSSELRKTIYLAGNSALLSTASSKMYQNTLIETAGGKNVASEIKDTYWATISYEQLLAYNPDIIVIVPFASYTKEDVLKDPRLQGLKAIKNKSVHKMPDGFEAWDSPVPSCILGTMWLSSILNEKQYPFDIFKADAAAFYKEFYNIKVNTEEITK